MGLISRAPRRQSFISMRASADWPIRIFYGLITAYQGLFGLFVPSSIFYQSLRQHEWAVLVISCLLLAGSLLVVDGAMAMLRYCTSVNCAQIDPTMALFHRWRHLLFLPPVFCYYLTLIVVARDMGPGSGVVHGYYIMLALCGVAFCLRDGIITNQCNRGSAA